MLVEMRRVDLVAPTARARTLVRAVHRFGAFHLAPLPDSGALGEVALRPGLPEADPLANASAAIAELTTAIGEVDAPRALVRELWDLDDAGLERRVRTLDAVSREVRSLARERLRLTAERTRTEGYRSLIDGLQTIVDRLPALAGYDSTAIVVQGRFRAVVGLLRDELEQLTGGRCELIAADLAGDRVGAALLYPRRLAADVRSLLGGRDLEEVPLPSEFTGLPFREIEARLVATIESIESRLRDVDGRLAELRRDHGQLAAALAVVLHDRAAEAVALAGGVRTDHLVVLSGWVPGDRLAELRRVVRRDVGSEALVAVGSEPPATADVPVAFVNRSLLRPFEPLATFVAVPRYGSLDPTPFIAMTLPVFIGLMVGDIGYGLLLLGLLGLARRRWARSPLLSAALPVGVLAAGATIVFGFLFGEAFGEAGARAIGLHPIWLDRREAAVSFLVLAIAIGACQVLLGLVLGILNALAVHDRSEAIGRGAMLAGLVSFAAVLGWLAGPVPTSLGYVAIAVLVTAIAVLVVTLGLAGPIELVGTIGNVLSYARLMAIGLASVMLAVVANEMASVMGNVLVGGFVAVLLHALNFALGFFDSSIQGLRLHYVEFFSKFVEPGGVRFSPFASALTDVDLGSGRAVAGGT